MLLFILHLLEQLIELRVGFLLETREGFNAFHQIILVELQLATDDVVAGAQVTRLIVVGDRPGLGARRNGYCLLISSRDFHLREGHVTDALVEVPLQLLPAAFRF